MAKARRRQAAEGEISEYMTNAGPRFLIKFTAEREDSRKDAAAALRAEIRRSKVGEWVEPSKQR